MIPPYHVTLEQGLRQRSQCFVVLSPTRLFIVVSCVILRRKHALGEKVKEKHDQNQNIRWVLVFAFLYRFMERLGLKEGSPLSVRVLAVFQNHVSWLCKGSRTGFPVRPDITLAPDQNCAEKWPFVRKGQPA